ncbi:GGDEF domain-containing protein [Pseudoalteromonas luteoviolacea]|uniref:GGDEF domain-containing protein n=1 Tax=Pseudoalteromonas luteoviolacea TaxID=43657 RepID=UPI001B372BE5|nr:GGDEF domain-containing protein [Pseudoalteromonas luteoviolacea]MBQ4810952.1 GGDEF domain-containing protein [Pseudoalteromonas luteoviolacea]
MRLLFVELYVVSMSDESSKLQIELLEQQIIALEMENHQLSQMVSASKLEIHKLREIQKLAKVGTWSLNHLSYKLTLSEELQFLLLGGETKTNTLSWDAFLDLIISENDNNIAQSITEDVVLGGQKKVFEHSIKTPDGQTRYIKHFCETFYNSIGQPLNSVGLMQDITDEKCNAMQLELLSVTDDLTGLFNRRKMNEVLVSQHDIVQRYQSDCSAILLDLDSFKQFNDLFGHQTGDIVLTTVANMMSSHMRSADICGRWGGEEFLIVCQNTACEHAAIAAEKLRTVLAAIELSCAKQVTASFGVAQIIKGEELTAFLQRLDKALYQSKNNGRNKVTVCN